MTSRMSKGRRVSFGTMPYSSSCGIRGARWRPHAASGERLRAVEVPNRISRAISSAWRVVFGEVIGHAGHAGVHVGAAQRFGIDHFAGGGLHQRRSAQEDGALVLDDDALVAHRRHVGAAGGATAHDHGDLRNVVRATAAPGCRRCGRSVRGPGTLRPAAAGRRRRNRPGRRRAGDSPARFPARADASSPSSGSRCRP